MTNTETGLTVVNAEVASVDLVEQLKNPNGQFYCSIQNDGTRKSAVSIYNAVMNADKRVENAINMTLEVINVVAHPVTLVDENTGEVITALRTVLVTKDGTGYEAVSQGITNALSRIFSIVGMPDGGAWEQEPVKMKIKQVATRNGNNKIMTIELV